jgi:hypothetical protein
MNLCFLLPIGMALLRAGTDLPSEAPPSPPVSITMDVYERIQPGMTRMQVYAILGGPPGDYCAPGHPRRRLKPMELDSPEFGLWISRSLTVGVFFDGRGRASGTIVFSRCIPVAEPAPFFVGWLRRVLPGNTSHAE